MENGRPLAGMLLTRGEATCLLETLSACIEVDERTEDNEPDDPDLARIVQRFNQFLGKSDGAELIGG